MKAFYRIFDCLVIFLILWHFKQKIDKIHKAIHYLVIFFSKKQKFDKIHKAKIWRSSAKIWQSSQGKTALWTFQPKIDTFTRPCDLFQQKAKNLQTSQGYIQPCDLFKPKFDKVHKAIKYNELFKPKWSLVNFFSQNLTKFTRPCDLLQPNLTKFTRL